MPKKRKRKEIVVDAPALRRPEELLRDTTGVEALEVFKASVKIGRRLSSLMIAVGALLSLLSVYGILTSAQFLFSNPLFIGALGFLGVLHREKSVLCALS